MITTKPLPGATIDYLHPITRGLIGRWLFNEGAGSRLADISGNGNHGTITNVDLTTGWGGSPQGRGLTVDGVDDHVVVPRSNSLRPLTSISVIAIVNGTGVGAFDIVLGHFVTSGNQRSWEIRTDAGANLFEIVLSTDGTSSGTQNKVYVSSVIAFDNIWHQIGFTFDGASSVLELYMDGVQDLNVTKTSDNAITSLHDSTADIFFGARSDNVLHWDGILSDVKIYNRALTQLEMQQLYANPYLGILD